MSRLLLVGEWKLQHQPNDNSGRVSPSGVPVAGLVESRDPAAASGGGGGVLLRAGQAGGVR